MQPGLEVRESRAKGETERENECLLNTYGKCFRPWPENQSLIPNGFSTKEESINLSSSLMKWKVKA